MGISFRHSAGFGKRMEYYLIGKMLMEGLDVYIPLVDDHGVDFIIKFVLSTNLIISGITTTFDKILYSEHLW